MDYYYFHTKMINQLKKKMNKKKIKPVKIKVVKPSINLEIVNKKTNVEFG